jgi:density-regulated protein DRP1
MAQLEAVTVIYCSKCGMPPEYCEYGPDYERVCEPYLKKKYPELYSKLRSLRGDETDGNEIGTETKNERPSEPWTIEERLTKFYETYVPEKTSRDVSTLLDKYAGKEDKLFIALVKKYGAEPLDPFYAPSDDEEEEDELVEGVDDLQIKTKKRRGIKAKKAVKSDTRVLIQKLTRNKKKAVTVVVGMDTVEGVKLKDVSKAFSKRFAGSSSVKDGPKGKEIIIQGDHMDDVAALIADKYSVNAEQIFFDVDGEFVAFK